MQEDLELYERCKRAVDKRLSGKRLMHVHSVSSCAAHLAEIYGVNSFDARMAGLLHDWDKLLTDEEFPARLKELNIDISDKVELLWPVLHSLTGARAVKREFPELSDEIISAISKHTMGALEMSSLDKVIFIADIIEPLRSTKKRPSIQKIRNEVAKVSLDQLYFDAYAATMISLISRKRYIHPSAFEIWNMLVQQEHERRTGAERRRQGDPDLVS